MISAVKILTPTFSAIWASGSSQRGRREAHQITFTNLHSLRVDGDVEGHNRSVHCAEFELSRRFHDILHGIANVVSQRVGS